MSLNLRLTRTLCLVVILLTSCVPASPPTTSREVTAQPQLTATVIEPSPLPVIATSTRSLSASQPVFVPQQCVKKLFQYESNVYASFNAAGDRLAIRYSPPMHTYVMTDLLILDLEHGQPDLQLKSLTLFPEYVLQVVSDVVTFGTVRSIQLSANGEELTYLYDTNSDPNLVSHIAKINLADGSHTVLRRCPKCLSISIGLSGKVYAVVLTKKGQGNEPSILSLVEFDTAADFNQFNVLASPIDWGELSPSPDENNLVFVAGDEHGFANYTVDLHSHELHHVGGSNYLSTSWLDNNSLLLNNSKSMVLSRYDLNQHMSEPYIEIESAFGSLHFDGIVGAMISPNKRHVLFLPSNGYAAYLADMTCATRYS